MTGDQSKAELVYCHAADLGRVTPRDFTLFQNLSAGSAHRFPSFSVSLLFSLSVVFFASRMSAPTRVESVGFQKNWCSCLFPLALTSLAVHDAEAIVYMGEVQ